MSSAASVAPPAAVPAPAEPVPPTPSVDARPGPPRGARPRTLPPSLPTGAGRIAAAATAVAAAALAILATGASAGLQMALASLILGAVLLLVTFTLGLRVSAIFSVAAVLGAAAAGVIMLTSDGTAATAISRSLLVVPALASVGFLVLILSGVPDSRSAAFGLIIGAFGALVVAAWPVLVVLAVYLGRLAGVSTPLMAIAAATLPLTWALSSFGREFSLQMAVFSGAIRDSTFRIVTTGAVAIAALWAGASVQTLVDDAAFGTPLESLAKPAGLIVAAATFLVLAWSALRLPRLLQAAQLRGRYRAAAVGESLTFLTLCCVAALVVTRVDAHLSLGRACAVAVVAGAAYGWCRLRFAAPTNDPNTPLWIVLTGGVTAASLNDAAEDAAAAWRAGQVTLLALPPHAKGVGGEHLHAAARAGDASVLFPLRAVQLDDWVEAQPQLWPALPVRELYAPADLWRQILTSLVEPNARILVLVHIERPVAAPAPIAESFRRVVRVVRDLPSSGKTDELAKAVGGLADSASQGRSALGLLVPLAHAREITPKSTADSLRALSAEELAGKAAILDRLRALQPTPEPIVVRHIMVTCSAAGVPLAERVARQIHGEHDARGRVIECWVVRQEIIAGAVTSALFTEIGVWRHSALLLGRLLEASQPESGLRRAAVQIALSLIGRNWTGEFDIVVVADANPMSLLGLPPHVAETVLRRGVVQRLIAVTSAATPGPDAGFQNPEDPEARKLMQMAALYTGEIRVAASAPVDVCAEQIVRKLLTLDFIPPVAVTLRDVSRPPDGETSALPQS